MKFHAGFHSTLSLSFAPSHSLISPLNSDLNCIYILQVLSYAHAPANCVSKHGKQLRSKKDVTSTRKGITHPRIHKFSPTVCVYTGWFLMNLSIRKFFPIVCVNRGRFLMNLYIHKFSSIMYRMILNEPTNSKMFSYYMRIYRMILNS